MYMHHMCRCICGWVLTKWNHQTPSLQNGLLETRGYFPGASNWNTSGTKLENNWNTTGTPTPEMEHNWYMHHKWRLHWRMSSYKMEPPDHQSTEWIAGNSRLFSRSLQLEHKWNKTRIRRQLEHKWNTHPRNGTQLEHKWDTTGTCITSDDAICGLLWDIHLVTGFHACLLFCWRFRIWFRSSGMAPSSSGILLHVFLCIFASFPPNKRRPKTTKITHTWNRSCGNPFGSNKTHEMGVVEQGVCFDNSHLPSIDLYRMEGTRSSVCNPILPIKWCFLIEWISETSSSFQCAPLQNGSFDVN